MSAMIWLFLISFNKKQFEQWMNWSSSTLWSTSWWDLYRRWSNYNWCWLIVYLIVNIWLCSNCISLWISLMSFLLISCRGVLVLLKLDLLNSKRHGDLSMVSQWFFTWLKLIHLKTIYNVVVFFFTWQTLVWLKMLDENSLD